MISTSTRLSALSATARAARGSLLYRNESIDDLRVRSAFNKVVEEVKRLTIFFDCGTPHLAQMLRTSATQPLSECRCIVNLLREPFVIECILHAIRD